MTTQDSRSLAQAKKLFKKAIYNPKQPIRVMRAHFDDVLTNPILPNNIDRTEVDTGNVQADLLVPEMAIGKKTILYAHGGSFIAGSRRAYRNMCASLAHESACRLLLPEYRLAPEYPFPTGLEDLYQAYAWLMREGVPHGQIIFAGDGAGANLILALIHYLREKIVPLPAGIAVFSPWVDLSCSSSAFTQKKQNDPLFTRDIMLAQARLYVHEDQFKNRHVSPILGDFACFPPLFIQCGTRDILIDDARRLAQKAANANIPVTLDEEEDMWPLFQGIDTLTPRAHLAIRKAGSWIREGAR
jgi:acetyl esterase/lipase